MTFDETGAHAVADARQGQGSIYLYWLPLGAGGHCVRLNGRVYEAGSAFVHRRTRLDLYHSALVVHLPEGTWAVESAPIREADGPERGVVGEGAVGSRWLGRFQIFRYELRCWRGGHIPDIAEAVDSPRRLSTDPLQARALLEVAQQAPTPVWGRDELGAGEWWNSNSFIAWVLARSGFDADRIRPPVGGRAPGWQAGVIVAGVDRPDIIRDALCGGARTDLQKRIGDRGVSRVSRANLPLRRCPAIARRSRQPSRPHTDDARGRG